LIFAGDLIGNLTPEVQQNWDRLMGNYEMAQVRDWAAQRSVETFVGEYNNRQIPVYMMNNLQDDLFQSNQMERFFSKLNYDDKRFDMYRGIHVTGELGGFLNVGGTLADFLGAGEIRGALAGIAQALGINFGHINNNVPWNNAHMWFDHYLKGIAIDPATGRMITAEEKVQLADKVADATFTDWVAPKDSVHVSKQKFYFDRSKENILAPLKNNLKTSTVSSSNYSIYTGQDTQATTAINLPANLDFFIDTISSFILDDITLSSVIGGLMEAHLPGVHRTADLDNFTKYYLNINCPIGCYREAGARYDTATFSGAKDIVGAINMSVWVKSQSPNLHLMAYVYEIDPWGGDKLITHGPVTRYNVPTNTAVELKFDMVFTSYTTEPGSKIAVVFDTEDPQYKKSGTYNQEVKFLHGGSTSSSIVIPFAN
ncbi:MAG TPA: CocE/NonD family hydrolase C-terminal non-catalytic domain-containing protein, partial [Dongiaceae bacterium]|nr:CocE/NonD family hydrolase C-terminal non-catalytic domain-containing protein [Dongiaceae bacterium]